MNQPEPNYIRVSQIIASALMMGVLVFAGVTVAFHLSDPQPAAGNQDSMLLIVAIVFTVGDLIARFVVLKTHDQNMARKLENRETESVSPNEVYGAYQTRLIISLAMLEGVAFFCLIAFMIEHRWEAFGLAMFLLLMMAMNFPTENKFRSWVRKLTGQSAFAGDEER